MNMRELLAKRAALIGQARALIDEADKTRRSLSPEEEAQSDALMTEVANMTADINRRQQLVALETDLAQPRESPVRPDPGGGTARPATQFRSRGMIGLNAAEPGWAEDPLWKQLWPYAEASYAKAYRGWLQRGSEISPIERKALLQTDSDSLGGYLVTPMQFVDQLIAAVDNLVYIRQWATIYAVPNADSLGAPSLDADPADPTWTSELAIGSEDSTMAFGKRELHPHPLAKYIKVSRKLLRQVPSVEDLAIQRLGYKFGVVQENNFLNGNGAGQPLGVFTASNDGVTTSRDVSTGNTATSIQTDGLLEAKFTLKPQYWPRARWLFHRDGVKQIAKLQDDNGQYIWRESTIVGEPDRLLGLPYVMSEYAPSTFTTGLYVGILGDFSYYWIADALNMEMQRLVELYAATNQIGLIGRLECDGMPVLSEAFVRVKLA